VKQVRGPVNKLRKFAAFFPYNTFAGAWKPGTHYRSLTMMFFILNQNTGQWYTQNFKQPEIDFRFNKARKINNNSTNSFFLFGEMHGNK
jgi:hypothetical protein